MSNTNTIKHCKQCDKEGNGNYCNNCGQSYTIKRITIATIIHEIFHFFSHLDKGILYTLKQLIVSPGKPQLEYIEGHRVKHQKPFSMFFLCATAAALIYYWTNSIIYHYFNAGEIEEAKFFHQYMVLLSVVMLPIYTLITYLFFAKSRYNYAEIFILLLYSLSFLVFCSSLLQFLKFIYPHLKTEIIELPLILLYNWLTNKNFFHSEPKWIIFVKTILSSALCFLIAGLAQAYVIEIIY